MKKLQLVWEETTRSLRGEDYRITFTETEYRLLWLMKTGTPITRS